jgi:hypothetical protein
MCIPGLHRTLVRVRISLDVRIPGFPGAARVPVVQDHSAPLMHSMLLVGLVPAIIGPGEKTYGKTWKTP